MSNAGKFRVLLVATTVLAASCGFGLGFWLGPRFTTVVRIPPAEVAAFEPTTYVTLRGWSDDPIIDAQPALEASCNIFSARAPDSVIGQGPIARSAKTWQVACARIAEARDSGALRKTLEDSFQPYTVTSSGDGKDQGLFTGYYEADLKGSLTREGAFQVPIYGMPRDLVTVDLTKFVPTLPADVARQIVGHLAAEGGHQTLQPYFSRQEIDADGAVANTADVLVWADDPVAVHILHIQGSGQVTLPDGRRLHLAFAGSNGQRFRGIGSILIQAGAMTPAEATMDKIRAWLQAHPTEAADYMNRNDRYIFFQIRADSDAPGPNGALGVALTPGRSLAVDQRAIPLGLPLWLETADPDGTPLHRLVAAQDTGAAITGAVRGDLFWGAGEAAFLKAARMRSPGRYVILVPRT